MNHNTLSLRSLRLGALVLALGLTACADMSGIAPATGRLRDNAALGLPAATSAPAAAPASVVSAQWWRDLGDEQLDRLVAQALQDSPSLKSAQSRLLRALAVTEVADSASKPQLTGSLDLTRQLFSGNGLYPAPLAGNIWDSGTARLTGGWELDFFGKHRAALDAALGSANAAQADAQAAAVLLASQVTRSYLQLARLNDQLTVARRTLAQRDETLRLVRDRVNAGLDTRLELRQSEGGLPEARQQIEALQEQMVLTRNALAALVGDPKLAPGITAPTLAALKPLAVPAQLPADLLAQRADVTAARWRVEAATKDVANAKTQFYPNINLVAFAGFNSIGFGKLLKSDSKEWGVGPAVRLPIFDGGRLRANLRTKNADLDGAIESYNSTVLDAVRDVADQVASTQSIERQRTEQRAAQTAAESAYEIALQRYQAGLGNYLNVLTAETSVLNQRRQAVDLAAREIDTQVALVRAVGGGYQPAQALASAGQATQAAQATSH